MPFKMSIYAMHLTGISYLYIFICATYETREAIKVHAYTKFLSICKDFEKGMDLCKWLGKRVDLPRAFVKVPTLPEGMYVCIYILVYVCMSMYR